MHVLRLEELPGRTVLRQALVSLAALSQSDALRCHCWTPAGSLLLGSAEGRLYIVRGAAQASPAVQQQRRLAAEPLFDEELSHWRSGAVVHIALTQRHLMLVYECPDGAGGLVLWLQENDPHVAAHVSLPTARITAAALSPARTHLVVRDEQARVAVITTAGTGDDFLEVVADGHGAAVVATSALAGAPPAVGPLGATLGASGRLCVWRLQSSARTASDEIVPRVTLLNACDLGVAAAAMSAHPQSPVLAVVTETGALQIIDGLALATANAVENETAAPVVHCGATALPPGPRKRLAWSRDGTLLAAADCDTGRIALLRRRGHKVQAERWQLELLGYVTAPLVDALRWSLDISGRSPPRLVLHLASGFLLVLQAPTAGAPAPGREFDESALMPMPWRLGARLADFRVMTDAAADGITVMGVARDRSIRCYKLSCASAASKRGIRAALASAPIAMPTVDNPQVRKASGASGDCACFAFCSNCRYKPHNAHDSQVSPTCRRHRSEAFCVCRLSLPAHRRSRWHRPAPGPQSSQNQARCTASRSRRLRWRSRRYACMAPRSMAPAACLSWRMISCLRATAPPWRSTWCCSRRLRMRSTQRQAECVHAPAWPAAFWRWTPTSHRAWRH